MVVSRKWLEYPSVRRVYSYIVARNGGYEYVNIESFLKGYVEPVYYLCKYAGYNDPESFIRDVNRGSLDLNRVVIDWRLWLIEKGRSPSSIIRYNVGLRKWLELNDLEVNWRYINKYAPLPKSRSVVEDRAPTREELRRLLNSANLRMKALIELAASTGMRVNSIVGLKVEDLDFNRDPRLIVIRVRPYLTKVKIGYYTLAHDEAREIISQYIESYDIREGWLFRSRKNDGPMTYEAVRLAWSRLLRKTGLNMKSKGIHVLHFHTLRKWFRTRLEGYLTRSQIEYLMGHLRKEYLDGSYFRPPSDDLIASYKAAMHRLYILWSEEPKIEDLRKKTLLDMAKLLGFREKTIRKIENMLEKKSVEDVLKELRRMRRL